MPTYSTLKIAVPEDFVLSRDCCSYGYFLLAPNFWNVKAQTLTRVLNINKRALRAVITQRATPTAASALTTSPSTPLTIRIEGDLPTSLPDGSPTSRTARTAARNTITAHITRMLRLDESAETLAEFHALDPRWKASGQGRLFRSPTFFEDVIKTVTSCNVQWPGTITMNTRLCAVVGKRLTSPKQASTSKKTIPHALRNADIDTHAFPAIDALALVRPATLRARCRVGYRDQRIVEIARLFKEATSKKSYSKNSSSLNSASKKPTLESAKKACINTFDLAAALDPATTDDDLFELLQELPGVGPYAAANILQLLGRYAHLPLDTESVRHGRVVLGFTGTPREVMNKVHAHFEPFGIHRFRSYWFEIWAYYEAKHGPAWTWQRSTTGKLFTAAMLAKK